VARAAELMRQATEGIGVDQVYRPLIEELRASSIAVYFQSPDQLVVSRQQGAVLPSNGNSFWLSHKEGSWYLGTWAPTCYRVPDEADLVRLCVEFAEHGRSAQPRVPPLLVESFHLVELSDEQAERLLGC
jgi:hypothetical protein